MYRIRLGGDEEAVFRTLEELTLAVRTGVVSPMSEVFHKTAGRWLPIELHPDYRAALSGKQPPVACDPAATPTAPAHVAQVPPPTRPVRSSGRVTPPAAAPVEGLVRTALDPGGQAPVALPIQVFEAVAEPAPAPTQLFKPRPGHRRRARQAATAAVAGIAIVAAVAYLAWRIILPRLERQQAQHYLSEGMPEPPAPEFELRTFVDTAYPAPSPPLPLNPGSDSAPAVVATHTSRLRATLNRTPTYFEAYADARAEMDDAFDYITFRRVLEPIRFASPESLRTTRRMVSAAGNILRVYRGREVMLEQNYRSDDPGGKGTLRERFETAEATRALISDVDSLFGILLAQQGRFVYSEQTLRFQDAGAARSYAGLRVSIATAVRIWRDSTSDRDLVTMPRLIRALGDFLPPPVQ